MQNDPLKIPFQYDLYLLFWIHGLYKDTVNIGPIGPVDIRKQLVSHKQCIRPVCSHQLHALLITSHHRLVRFINIVGSFHCFAELFHSGFLVIGHKTKIKADVFQFPEKTDCPVICGCIVRHQGIIYIK